MSMPSPVRDALPVALALALCPLVAMLAPDDPADALTRARSLVEAQRALGVTPEPALVRALDAHPSLRALTEVFYVWVHLPALVGALVWVRLERPRAFSFARDTFVAAQVVTVTGYLLVPAAPPWMLEAGMTRAPERLAYLLQSPYAAMPSGHTVFALVAGGCVALLTRHPLVRAAGAAYPVLVLLVVLATGNHVWLDVAGGGVAAGLGAALAAIRRLPAPRTDRFRAGLRTSVVRRGGT
jgi:membrane-associated phospholipid phosphatase